ncbi:hypothetical protein [Hamadaea tsunoensis]|uniref:hypothetical protein n=1 Tax=Hamadaea tsunoensis TaxID=53368 RepID=UPI00040D8F90|nr:hypothetical protein [Hamadaea tsunoensis]
MKRLAITALALVSAALSVAVPAAPATAAPANGIKGATEGTIRESANRADGLRHLDTPAMISRLLALHANTYDYVIENAADWPDFAEFLPAAQAAGIRVFAYLVPPSECPSSAAAPKSCDLYAPYHKDYVAWGKAIAQLSLTYPNLTGWTVDDMDYWLSLYTASYVQSMRSAARAVQPSLDFYLQLYRPAITQSLVDSYAAGIDGLIMPYRDDPYSNTIWSSASTMQAQVDAVTAIANRDGKRLILMLYGNKLSSSMLAPDKDYVATLTAQAVADTASGQIAGVILWNLPLGATGVPAGSSSNLARSGLGVLSFTVAANRATVAGQYAQAATTVALDAGSSSCTMVLWRQDSRDTTSPAGYHQKQAYVGGSLVWASDVASEGTDWYTSSALDITSHLTNGSATLVLRLMEMKAVSNYSVSVLFDDVQLTGCHVTDPGFESDASWSVSRSGGPVLATVYQYSPTFSTDTFDAVAALF